jgi:hypothetical protein
VARRRCCGERDHRRTTIATLRPKRRKFVNARPWVRMLAQRALHPKKLRVTVDRHAELAAKNHCER